MGLLVVLVGLIFARDQAAKIALSVPIMLVIFTLIGWTIYGYKLFSDPMNDCGFNPETSNW